MSLKFQNLKNKFKNQKWRLNNLYKIKDKNANVIRFKMNKIQENLFNNFHYRNIILKARQLGFTTFIDLFFLDTCLFTKNVTAGIIAHNIEDAKKIFREKIKYPYTNLPKEIKEIITANTDRAKEYVFSNGSTISVSTSFRSGTVQLLHVSELAKISAKYPEKAKEIKTGASEAVPKNGLIFFESTAEGQDGVFYDTFEKAKEKKTDLSNLHFKNHFFAWFLDPEYKAEKKYYNQNLDDYFRDLELNYNIKLTKEQKAWYSLKKEDLQDDIKREYPSIPEEAFESSIIGSYYKKQFNYLQKNKRVGVKNLYDKNLKTYTFWDLGVGDENAIWFIQIAKNDKKTRYRIIDYYENSGEGLDFYLDYCKNKHYNYKEFVAPHDIKVREWTSGISRLDIARKKGVNFQIAPQVSIEDGINAVRKILKNCVFDKKAEIGYKKLKRYKKKWDEKRGCFKNKPMHDDASHAADAFRYFAVTAKKITQKTSDVIEIF